MKNPSGFCFAFHAEIKYKIHFTFYHDYTVLVAM